MIIREAQEQDFPAICTLIKDELGYSKLNNAETINRLRCFSESNDWITYVASDDSGEILGFIGVMKGLAYNIEGYYSQIMALAVSRKSQRKGIGSKLVKKAEEWSITNGITDIGVSSGIKRLDAHAFYQKNDYVKKSFSFIKILNKD
jgi:predicted N-acetyltransferase YhbS